MTRHRRTAPMPTAAGLAMAGLLSLTGAVPTSAADALDSFKVTRPGTVLIDRAQRLRELNELGPAAQALCQVTRQRDKMAASVAPVLSLEGRDSYAGNDRHVAPFDRAVIVHGSDAFSGSDAARERFLSLVAGWAKAGAMTKLVDDVAGSNTVVAFGLRRSLATLIPIWALIREDSQVEADDKTVIDAWLGKLVALADVNTGTANRANRPLNCPANQPTNNCNSHRYLRDLVNVMWGAMSGDDVRYRKGIERVHVALRQMRADGSLPLETQRGAKALWYQNYALGMLVTIAEVAARQGHDLYAIDINGRSLHKAVAFLIEAIARPRVVLPYAEANVSPGGAYDWREQDLRFTEYSGLWHHMAWAEAYMARFPDHANTRRLRRALPGLAEDRPLVARVTGGNASCFFARR